MAYSVHLASCNSFHLLGEASSSNKSQHKRPCTSALDCSLSTSNRNTKHVRTRRNHLLKAKRATNASTIPLSPRSRISHRRLQSVVTRATNKPVEEDASKGGFNPVETARLALLKYLKDNFSVGDGSALGSDSKSTLVADAVDAGDYSNIQVTEPSFKDVVSIWVTNILQVYEGEESVDGAPLAEGAVDDLVGGPLFIPLYKYFLQYGGCYKLCFGPKTFMVVSDPAIAKHIFADDPFKFDKGVLAEILAPIMGKGLIPADFDTWKVRRRAVVPGFHRAWLERMVQLFGECTDTLTAKLAAAADQSKSVDIENLFTAASLDIIGLAVFNYDFASVKDDSPIIKAVFSALREAEHRATFYLPYWDIPLVGKKLELGGEGGLALGPLVPRQAQFVRDMDVLCNTVDDLIARERVRSEKEAMEEAGDAEALQNRDYSKVLDPSLLRFLVDMRGEDVSNKILRDDLLTFLVAGHETTAAVLTWAAFCCAQDKRVLRRAQAELDHVLGDHAGPPSYAQIRELKYVRLIVAEALRLYPEPPIMIRRALEDHRVPVEAARSGQPGAEGQQGVRLLPASDLFISVYNLHRSPLCWERPNVFEPERFMRPFSNPDAPAWKGFDPTKWEDKQLYPNEVAADFAYMPFGGGARKCVGDQFAFMESVCMLGAVLHQFDLDLDCEPGDVGMVTGATIHTDGGLPMKLTRRNMGSTADDYSPVTLESEAGTCYPSVAKSPLQPTERNAVAVKDVPEIPVDGDEAKEKTKEEAVL